MPVMMLLHATVMEPATKMELVTVMQDSQAMIAILQVKASLIKKCTCIIHITMFVEIGLLFLVTFLILRSTVVAAFDLSEHIIIGVELFFTMFFFICFHIFI